MRSIAYRLRIAGRVQGVWYRGWTEKTALSLGLCGWVRNRADGSVEAVIVGAPDAVETMIQRCHSGPPAARVEGVKATPIDLPEDIEGFSQRSTF